MDETTALTLVMIGCIIAAVVLPRLVVERIMDAAPRTQPLPGRFAFWTTLFVLLPGLTVDPSGVLVLLLLIGWCCVVVWRLAPRWIAALPAVCPALLVMGFFNGYKLCGERVLVDNRPLIHRPIYLERAEYPNVLVEWDGSRHLVPGVIFSQEFCRSAQTLYLHLGKDPGFPSGFVVERNAIHHACSHSFRPELFPPRLPSFELRDLGEFLDEIGKLKPRPAEPSPH
jgi:hypothetical protein